MSIKIEKKKFFPQIFIGIFHLHAVSGPARETHPLSNSVFFTQEEAEELGKNIPVDKIFVGGIAQETTRREVVDYFTTHYGCKVLKVCKWVKGATQR